MVPPQLNSRLGFINLGLTLIITEGSSSGATLSFALQSKGEGGQPPYLIIQEIASHFSTPRTLRADPKHCNLQYFCSCRI